MYLLAILDSVLKNIGEACAVLVIYAAQARRAGGSRRPSVGLSPGGNPKLQSSSLLNSEMII